MVIVTILLILTALWLIRFFCLFSHGLSGVRITSSPKPGQIKIACVGDSITYGHGITGWPRNTYPYLLQRLLGKGFHVNNFGACGRSVHPDTDRPYVAEPHYRESLAYGADVVIFMMGTNDAKVDNWHGPDAFRQAFGKLLDSYGDSRIILCTPATAFPQNASQQDVVCYDIQLSAVSQVDAIVRSVAQQRSLPLVDIQELTASHPEWYIADKIHPGNVGAAAIAKKVYEVIADKNII